MSLVMTEKLEGGLLTEKEEKTLFKLLNLAKKYGYEKDEKRIKDKIAKKFTLIVSKEVNRLRMYNFDRNELLGQGYYALAYAINGFDVEKGFRFSTYASKCINLLLLAYVGKNHSVCDMSKNKDIKKIFFKVRNLVAAKSHESGTNYLTAEIAQSIADELGVSVKDVEWVYGQFDKPKYCVQTDMVSGDSYSPNTGTSVRHSDELSPEEEYAKTEKQELMKQLIWEAMEVLDEREKQIYERSNLEKSGKNEPLCAIGKDWNITGERVRQIKSVADQKIKQKLAKIMKSRNIDIKDVVEQTA